MAVVHYMPDPRVVTNCQSVRVRTHRRARTGEFGRHAHSAGVRVAWPAVNRISLRKSKHDDGWVASVASVLEELLERARLEVGIARVFVERRNDNALLAMIVGAPMHDAIAAR